MKVECFVCGENVGDAESDGGFDLDAGAVVWERPNGMMRHLGIVVCAACLEARKGRVFESTDRVTRVVSVWEPDE